MGLFTGLKDSISRATDRLFSDAEPKRIGIYGPPNAGKCLASDEEVLLADGTYRSIEDVYATVSARPDATDVSDDSDETWLECRDADLRVPALGEDLSVSPRSVSHVFRQRYVGPMYRVQTKLGREVTVSPDHPFVSMTDDGIGTTRAADVETGQPIATVSEFAPEEPPRTKVSNDSLSSTTPDSFSADGGQVVYDAPHHDPKPIAPLPLDVEVARFLALTIAEAKYDDRQIAFRNDDPELREEFEATANRFGIDTTTYDYDGETPVVRANGRSLVQSLERFDCHPSAPADRCVPASILAADDEIVRSFLRAMFDCEGSVRGATGEQRRPIVTVSSASRELVVGIQILLLRFGIVGTIREKHHDGEAYYEFCIERSDHHRRFRDVVGFDTAAKSERLDDDESDVVWDAVDEIERVDYDGYIYDLTVEDDHTFATRDGLVVHNTTLANRIARDWTGDAIGTESHIPHETRRARRKENVEIERNGKTVTIDIVDTPGVTTKVDYEEFMDDMDKEDAVRRSREATEGVAEAMHWLREDVDGVVYVLDSAQDPITQVNTMLIGIIESQDLPVLIFANKIDLDESSVKRIEDAFPQHETVPLSAKEGDNMDEVYESIAEYFG